MTCPSLSSRFNHPGQDTEETTTPVENVVLTTKGLQERKIGEIILTEIFPSVHET